MVRVAIIFCLAFSCSPLVGNDAGTDSGIRCRVPIPLPDRAMVYDAKEPFIIPITTVELAPEWGTGSCIDTNSFEFRRVDREGLNGTFVIRDEHVEITVPTPGVYFIYNVTLNRFHTFPWFFAEKIQEPAVTMPWRCTEIDRLNASDWACDNKLFPPSPPQDVRRWRADGDGGVYSIRYSGLFVQPANEIRFETTKKLVWENSEIETWAFADDGISIATTIGFDAGFYECLWGQTCQFISERFGVVDKYSVPVEQQEIEAFLRFDGRTFFSLSKVDFRPYCEAKSDDAGYCFKAELQAFVSVQGNTVWARSHYLDDESYWSYPLQYQNKNWKPGTMLRAPPDFKPLMNKKRLPNRNMWVGRNQILFHNSQSQAHSYEFMPIRAGLLAAGANDGFMWVSYENNITTVHPAKE